MISILNHTQYLEEDPMKTPLLLIACILAFHSMPLIAGKKNKKPTLTMLSLACACKDHCVDLCEPQNVVAVASACKNDCIDCGSYCFSQDMVDHSLLCSYAYATTIKHSCSTESLLDATETCIALTLMAPFVFPLSHLQAKEVALEKRKNRDHME